MKTFYTMLIFLSFFLFSQCSNDKTSKKYSINISSETDESMTSEIIDETENDNSNNLIVHTDFSKSWIKFRDGVLNNDPEFDWLKYIDVELLVKQDFILGIFEEEMFRENLQGLEYNDMDEETIDGVSYRKFYAVAASSGMVLGTVIWFKEDAITGDVLITKLTSFDEVN